MAHRDLIEQQYRNLQAIPALQLRIGVDVEQPQRRQRMAHAQRLQLMQHVVAQPALGRSQQRQPVLGSARRQAQCRPAPAIGPAPKAAPPALPPAMPGAPKLPGPLLLPKPSRPLPRPWLSGFAAGLGLAEISSKIE